MYPAVSDSPYGPFKLAKGVDTFSKIFTSATLWVYSGRKEDLVRLLSKHLLMVFAGFEIENIDSEYG